ncbi:MAG: hypothetical protein JSS57_01755 [Proteobacteria bacterium]|nr:hypothetical protein [Pseudomonadota bacterium]RTL30282.1 MAG: hypothetical protein EKK49_13410 [Rhodocyclaceae bacterium]
MPGNSVDEKDSSGMQTPPPSQHSPEEDARVTAVIDCSTMRLGDRMACAWMAQQRHRTTGERFALIDRHPVLSRDFPLPRYFGETFVDWSEARIAAAALPRWDMGNLWLTVTNAFAANPRAGRFEMLPADIAAQARELAAATPGGKPRILVHVLDDAPYNMARRWRRKDADALCDELRRLGGEVVLLNPASAQFIGGFERMLAEMLAADLFVGGDTGPSHVFALLCADKPQVAVYPSMLKDQRKFAADQARLGLALPWDSLPKRPALRVITMKRRLALIWHERQLLLRRAGLFDGRDVARQVMAELAAHTKG